jgi:hypothetical protein
LTVLAPGDDAIDVSDAGDMPRWGHRPEVPVGDALHRPNCSDWRDAAKRFALAVRRDLPIQNADATAIAEFKAALVEAELLAP